MALPKLTVPFYDVVCPSGQRISFRPFLVKEEKLLLIALESKDADTIFKTVLQVLQNCVGDVSNIKVEKLPLFDIEFLFLNLRARSIGEQVKLKYECKTPVSNTETGIETSCGTISEYFINLLEIKPSFGEGHNKYIELTDSVGITLKYPTFKSFQKVARKDLPPDEAFSFLLECIESINDADTVTMASDVTANELESFIDTLSHEQIAKMDKFFNTMPKIESVIHFNCPKCGAKEDIKVSGLDDFFV